MFLSHLSITFFQSIFICVASHLLSQSLCLARVDMSPSKSLAVCFCLLSCPFSLCAFPLPCEKLLRVFVTSSSHFHGDQPWLTALTEVSSSQGPGKAWRNVCVCKIGSAHVFVGAFLHLSMHTCTSGFWSPAWVFIFLVEGLLWCLSQWHRQINQGRVNLSRAISAEPSTVLQVCLFILHVSFEPPTTNTHTHTLIYLNLYNPRERRKQKRVKVTYDEERQNAGKTE